MQDIQDVYNRIQQKKKDRKKIKSLFNEAFDGNTKIQELKDEIKKLQAQKKEIEMEVRADYGTELQDLENIESDIKSDQELMDDIAISTYMKGESISFKDEDDTEFEPVFKVSYKKVG
ncbi:hypothetical protein GF380_04445 [Candidatus Uhrbacteria bacterium]|nr:hypothetical protein [Candidatus Uhrbacteria bacterium]MBD3284310.1 hypothetical protein [Candidatus Uhrbacteria bacterium]